MPRRSSEPLDQAGIDQQAIETSRFGTAGASVELSPTTLEYPFLLGKGSIERQAGELLRDHRQVRAFDRLAGLLHIDRLIIDGVDGIIGGEIARIVAREPLRDARLVERRLQDEGCKIRLVVAVADQEEGIVGEIA